MNTAWNYATLAFQPYPDVGEFVNVGVLALAVPARVLAYRLLPAQATARIHGFFPELDITIYKEGRRRIEIELQRLEATINSVHGVGVHAADQPPLPGAEVQADTLFKALTAPVTDSSASTPKAPASRPPFGQDAPGHAWCCPHRHPGC